MAGWWNRRAQGTKLGTLRSLVPLRPAAWSIGQSTLELDLGKPLLEGLLLNDRVPVLRSLGGLVWHLVQVGSPDLRLVRELLLEHWLLHRDLLHGSLALKLLILQRVLLLELASDSCRRDVETIDNWVRNLA